MNNNPNISKTDWMGLIAFTLGILLIFGTSGYGVATIIEQSNKTQENFRISKVEKEFPDWSNEALQVYVNQLKNGTIKRTLPNELTINDLEIYLKRKTSKSNKQKEIKRIENQIENDRKTIKKIIEATKKEKSNTEAIEKFYIDGIPIDGVMPYIDLTPN